jgi:hypothetical protein
MQSFILQIPVGQTLERKIFMKRFWIFSVVKGGLGKQATRLKIDLHHLCYGKLGQIFHLLLVFVASKPPLFQIVHVSDILNNELFNKELDKKPLFCRPKPRI